MKTTHLTLTLPIVAAILFAAPASVVLADCKTDEAIAGWKALIEKHPDDTDLRTLYKMWGELCDAVEQGHLDEDTASERFEHAREWLLEKWRRMNEQREAGERDAA